MGRKKILMIAYHFPPIGGAGSLRPMKMAKYLPVYGWDPIVLTVRNADWYYAHDDHLLGELDGTVPVVRTTMLRSAWFYRLLNPFRIRKLDLFLRRYLIHPDDQIGWFPFAVRAASMLIKKGHIDAVYSTSAPLTTHLIACHLVHAFGIPWVADFRDEWYENPDLPLPTAFHRRFHYQLEGMIVSNATRVIAAAPIFCHYLTKHWPGAGKFEVLTMGFDPDDYREDGERPALRNETFTLTFSGLFYGSFRPDPLLKAVNALVEEGKVQRQKIRLQFVGANSALDLREPDKYGVCTFTGFLPHRMALQVARQSDALLLLLSRERGRDVIPSKTFEYMGLRKPVLAIVPADGEAARIVRETGIGLVADFESVQDIRQACLQLYQQWADGSLSITQHRERVDAYSYVQLTRRLGTMLDMMVQEPLNACRNR